MTQLREPGARISRSSSELLAWSIVSIWLVAYSTRSIKRNDGINDAISWFFAHENVEVVNAIPKYVILECEKALSICDDPSSSFLFLPYILDPHGPINRTSVLQDASSRAARDSKRSTGVYYTPIDVASYMLNEVMCAIVKESPLPQVFDPACGTGVFLRAALIELSTAHPQIPIHLLSRRLFGTDIDPVAIRIATFVLLADCIENDKCHKSPFDVWQSLRENLLCVDALRLDPSTFRHNTSIGASNRTDSSHISWNTPDVDEKRVTRFTLSQIFPHIKDTPLAIIGNPPYAKIGSREDLDTLSTRFSTMASRTTESSATFPLFIEQMIRLSTTTRSVGTMVVPLSLACNVGPQFVALRELIERTPGTWRFAFFDREPHSLFGEDVKTRNAILFWDRTREDGCSNISSGPLLKWRSVDRAQMLTSIRFTPLTSGISKGIPKLDGVSQSRAYELLTKNRTPFSNHYEPLARIPLAQSIHADPCTIFVSSTAYNFVNVFLSPPMETLPTRYKLSEHPLYCLRFQSEEYAMLGFALLSSYLTYWWWRATQDGFHVPARFLNNLPFGAIDFSAKVHFDLAMRGADLWALVSKQPIVSINKGKASLAFPSHQFRRERLNIDELLAPCLGLDKNFSSELRRFVDDTISAKFDRPRKYRNLD